MIDELRISGQVLGGTHVGRRKHLRLLCDLNVVPRADPAVEAVRAAGELADAVV